MTDHQRSMAELGLPVDAGIDQIEQAYKARSRALKSLILGTTRATVKEQHRTELRKLVCRRERALGRAPRADWCTGRLPLSSTRLIGRIRELEPTRISRKAARAFLGLPAHADPATIIEAYRLRKRVLVRRLARTSDDRELERIHRARRKLRTIRNFALA